MLDSACYLVHRVEQCDRFTDLVSIRKREHRDMEYGRRGCVEFYIESFVDLPIWGVGAAISTFSAEFVVLFIQILVGRSYLPIRLYEWDYLNYLLASGVLFVVLYGLTFWIVNSWLLIMVSVMIGAFSYIGFLWFKRDVLFLEVLGYITKLIKK